MINMRDFVAKKSSRGSEEMLFVLCCNDEPIARQLSQAHTWPGKMNLKETCSCPVMLAY
jgi:hypothetical protein